MTYPRLPKTYKNRFPFKICSTSFIYPDLYVPNLKMLGPYLDEVELLFFESNYKEALPSQREVEIIREILNKCDTSCNVHLPLDISLGDTDRQVRSTAVETIQNILELTAPLSPTTFTLHLTFEENNRSAPNVKSWQGRLCDSLNQIFAKAPPESFSIENLVNYPFEWVEEVIENTGVHICMDVGHHLERNEDFKAHFFRKIEKIDILHIYGVSSHKDHISLKHLGKKHSEELIQVLNSFSRAVSVEVFTFDDLKKSLDVLECWAELAGWGNETF